LNSLPGGGGFGGAVERSASWWQAASMKSNSAKIVNLEGNVIMRIFIESVTPWENRCGETFTFRG
jgi:hypothetical protein